MEGSEGFWPDTAHRRRVGKRCSMPGCEEPLAISVNAIARPTGAQREHSRSIYVSFCERHGQEIYLEIEAFLERKRG